jgi:hypothetical protein
MTEHTNLDAENRTDAEHFADFIEAAKKQLDEMTVEDSYGIILVRVRTSGSADIFSNLGEEERSEIMGNIVLSTALAAMNADPNSNDKDN